METFYMHSQKYILDELIPNLEYLAYNVEEDSTNNKTIWGLKMITHTYVPKTKDYYLTQANIWRQIIQSNEKAKYDAINNRASHLNKLKDTIINDFFTDRKGDSEDISECNQSKRMNY